MCVFFRIFVCETEKEKAPIYEVQRYEEIWIHASISPDKNNDPWEMPLMACILGKYET